MGGNLCVRKFFCVCIEKDFGEKEKSLIQTKKSVRI